MEIKIHNLGVVMSGCGQTPRVLWEILSSLVRTKEVERRLKMDGSDRFVMVVPREMAKIMMVTCDIGDYVSYMNRLVRDWNFKVIADDSDYKGCIDERCVFSIVVNQRVTWVGELTPLGAW